MNRVTEHTGSKYPIIQAPMGWIARSQLASAVCNAGGFGVIETSSGEVDNCKAEIEKTLEMGPKPVEGDIIKLEKRKKISSEAQRNYLLIPDDFPLLKQRVTLNFKNLDFKETMTLMGKIGEINVLVGDEVAGAISAELINVPWDNLIRVHSPETLTAQETYKSERASAVRKKVELEDSVEPIYSEIFRLYYISPAEA